ncbi:MAG TPA: cupin domain-containing protein [Capillimicrobium sp.]|jgi:hypothetical protein
MSAVRRAHVAELGTIEPEDPDYPEWIPVRAPLGVRAFGVNAWVGRQPGDPVIERHDEAPGDDGEPGHEELYVVLEGEAEFVVDGERFRAGAGELVFLGDPTVTREARAVAPSTRVLAIGAAPGVAFEPSAWEQRELRKNGWDPGPSA